MSYYHRETFWMCFMFEWFQAPMFQGLEWRVSAHALSGDQTIAVSATAKNSGKERDLPRHGTSYREERSEVKRTYLCTLGMGIGEEKIAKRRKGGEREFIENEIEVCMCSTKNSGLKKTKLT